MDKNENLNRRKTEKRKEKGPGSNSIRSGRANPFGLLNSGAVPVGDKSSVDLVFAVGAHLA